MWRSQKVASKWNGWLRDSLRVCGRSTGWRGDADDDSGRWLHFGGGCLGMQEERDEESESQRQERWWWWEENEKLKCALPWGDLYKWPQIEGMLCGMHTDFAAYVQFIFPSLSWWCCTLRDGGTEGGWECGAVEEWLPGVELRDVERVFYFVNWSVQMEMSERPEN